MDLQLHRRGTGGEGCGHIAVEEAEVFYADVLELANFVLENSALGQALGVAKNFPSLTNIVQLSQWLDQ